MHGSTKNRGSRPSHHVDASGSVDRKVCQALEQLGVVERLGGSGGGDDDDAEEGTGSGKRSRGGRRITQAGMRDLDRIAQTAAEESEDEAED